MMSRVASLTIAALFVAGCSSEPQQPTAPFSVPIVTTGAQTSASPNASPESNGGNYGTPLTPREEVMPAGVINTSNARGNAIFQLSADGTSLSYQLVVANIENVFQAHIHRAPAGSNGGIVVWLFPSTAPTPGPKGQGRVDGVIAEGTITAANLVGALAGHPLSDLVALLQNGGAYVNAHTDDGDATPNEGPGDYPGGELRGQVEHRGHY
jgi:hypothetical protein